MTRVRGIQKLKTLKKHDRMVERRLERAQGKAGRREEHARRRAMRRTQTCGWGGALAAALLGACLVWAWA